MTIMKTITLRSDGKDQKGILVGTPQKGDEVHLNIKGYYIKVKKGGKVKQKEFEDTRHKGKMTKFTIGTNQSIMVGLEAAVMEMQLGEEATIELTPDVGFGNNVYRGYCGTVPPNSDLVLKVDLMKVLRNGTLHYRHQRAGAGGDAWGSSMF